MDKKELIKEVLTRSTSYIIPSPEALEKELLSGKKLKIYLGADPTGPHLHLGHLTNLLLLKRLQDLGHKVIFLVGDFTAMIGDPTDKLATRKPLTEKDVKENMRTFKKQASHIISFFSWMHPSSWGNGVKIRYNSEWYEKMTLKKFMKDLLGYFDVQNMLYREEYFTIQNMLQRDMFKERLKKWETSQHTEGLIGLKEFIYPILQGYDGVAMNVDIEVGGNDQMFNMAIGRALRKAHVEKNTTPGEKFFVATKLLINPKTGKKLMNKSEGGLINLDDSPENIFGKVMALDDSSMFAVAEHCTFLPLTHIKDLQKMNPREAKLEIATAVVNTIYGKTAAEKARENWINTFSKKEINATELPPLEIKSEEKITVSDLVLLSKTADSKSEARRLAKQGAVEINGEAIKDVYEVLKLNSGDIIKIGKKNFFRIKIK